MPEKAPPQPSPEPQEFPHIFAEVVFQLIPEVNYENLVRISQLLKINQNMENYSSLTYALRKIQWAKLSALEAIEVEQDIAEQKEGGNIAINPICQAQHAKSLYEFVLHIKAALDLLAVFLAGLLSLSTEESGCDLKYKEFRDGVAAKDIEIGQYLKSLESWFLDIQERKEKWAYHYATRVFLIPESADLGLLPVAKVVTEDYALQDLPPTSKFYRTTPEFAEFHFNKLASFFNLIVERCIKIELAKIETPPALPEEVPLLSAFPLRVAQQQEKLAKEGV
ncbi:MAG: hypothetical protein ABIB93_00320 [Chloroflexota bacterium]